MVSFSCENCGDVLTKGKLDKHVGRCRGASFTCLDCMVHFTGSSYKSHTSCMTEAQKYDGSRHKEKQRGQKSQAQDHGTLSKAMIPRKAYVEDEGDTEMGDAIVVDEEVPPRAPSPPREEHGLPPGTNVFDYLVEEDSSQALAKKNSHLADTQVSNMSDDSHLMRHGYSYGNTPVQPSLGRYESYSSLVRHTGQSQDGHSYVTPAPSRERRSKDDKHSDKKRKRFAADDVDTSRMRYHEDEALNHIHGDARRSLHSGLTGGLDRLLSRPVEEYERQAGLLQSPLSPKRSKRDGTERQSDRRKVSGESHRTSRRDEGQPAGSGVSRQSEEARQKAHRNRARRGSSSSEDRQRAPHGTQKAIEYGKPSADPAHDSQLVQYRNPADHFMSFIKEMSGERGQSINKILKRYHREKRSQGDQDGDADDKDLWKELRVRRNDRGEIVLFT